MARHGENVRKRKDGRWEARYQIFDADKGQKVYRSVYGNTYAAVKEKRSAAVRKAGNPAGARPCTALRFSQAAEEWLEEIADKRKYSTYIKYKNIYRNHLEKISGSYLLSDTLWPDLREKILVHLSKEDLSESIRRSVCCTTNQILVFAEEKYGVCIPLLKLPMIKHLPVRPKTLSKAEQSKLLAVICTEVAASEPSASATPEALPTQEASVHGRPVADRASRTLTTAILLCLYTGIRLGELCALKWTDIDCKNRTVTINRTVQRIAAQSHPSKTILMETSPKSESSKRTIPLTVSVLERLWELKRDSLYIFGEEKPLDPRTMQYRFKKILKEAGVDDRNFHTLRHAFATNCIENGMDIKALSEILGHSDVKITLNRYVHPTMDAKREQIGSLSDYYGQICGPAV